MKVINKPIEVLLDISLRGVASRPLSPGSERKRVEMRRHIAGRAGVMIGVPDPAHTLTALEQSEVGNALLQQANSRSYSPEPTPDNRCRDRFIRMTCHYGPRNA